MQKIAIILVLMITFSLLFAGVVSAKGPSTQVGVVDENGNPIGTAYPGEQVAVIIQVEANDAHLLDPYMTLNIKPENALVLDYKNALMRNGAIWAVNSDPVNGNFLVWNSADKVWVWNMQTWRLRSWRECLSRCRCHSFCRWKNRGTC